MKSNAAILILLLSVLGFATAGETINKEFKVVRGKTLDIDLRTGGSLKITGWDKEVVRVAGSFEGRDAGICHVDVEEESDGIHITSYHKGRRSNYNAHLDLEISVPNRFNLNLETMGGGITLADIEGTIEGRTMGGPLNLSGLKGSLDLITMGGKVSLTNSDVDGRVKTMGGEVHVQDVTGDVNATSQGGNVTQRNVKRRSGAGIRNEVSIKTMGGDINVDDAPEGADVHTMGGDIHIRQATRFARAKTMGGNIEIDGVDGRIEATTMGGDVTVRMIGDPEKGDRSVEIQSMGGDVTLTVPSTLSMDIDITLAFTRERHGDYRIISDFDVKQEESTDWDRRHGTPRKYLYGTGRTAGGKHKVHIRTVNGNVYLKKG